MTLHHGLSTLRAHEAELRAVGVRSASVFGSMARNEQDSADVDIAIQLTKDFSNGGFHYFGRLEALEQQLTEWLGCKVLEEQVRRALFQFEIDRDRALAF